MGGKGAGEGPGARPGDTSFRREHIPASGILPEGQVVGSFTVDGAAEAGEATIEKGGGLEQAVRDLSEQVDREPLPVEQKAQVLRFQDLLLGGGGAGTSEK